MNVIISHVYRESNKIADDLANRGCRHQSFMMYGQWEQLPIGIKGLLNLDRLVCPI